MGLPFKPHRVQPVAKEIDASMCSHPQIDYRLYPIPITKPDYSLLVATIPVSRIQQDPRLRRYAKKRPLIPDPILSAAAMETRSASSPNSEQSSVKNDQPLERPSDPRRKNVPSQSTKPAQGQSTTLSPVQSTKPALMGSYNPKDDFGVQHQGEDSYHRKGLPMDAYSPSEDVYDVYGAQSGRVNQRSQHRGPDFSYHQNSSFQNQQVISICIFIFIYVSYFYAYLRL